MSDPRPENAGGGPVSRSPPDPPQIGTVDVTGAASSVSDPRATVAHVPAPPDDKAALPDVPGYEILGVLGRGGMGVVYKTWQIGLKRHVALKMIRAGSLADAEDLERFRAEAEAVARLQHPNLAVAFHPGGDLLACASGDQVVVWQTADGQPAAKLSVPGAFLRDLEFARDGQHLLASASSPDAVVVWAADTWREKLRQVTKDWQTESVQFWKDSDHLALRSQLSIVGQKEPRQRVRLFERYGKAAVAEFQARPGGLILGVHPSAQRVVVWNPNQTLSFWDFGAAAPATTLPLPAAFAQGKWAFSADGRFLACVGNPVGPKKVATPVVKVWTTAPVREIPIRQDWKDTSGATHLFLSPDGTRLLLLVVSGGSGPGSHRTQLWQWRLPDGQPLDEFNNKAAGQKGPFTCAAFSPDGRILALAGPPAIVLLDAERGTELRAPLKSHAADVSTLTFSPDGRRLVSGDQAGAVKIWDTATWQELQTLQGPATKNGTATFSPDGRQLVLFGTEYRHLMIYDGEPPEAAAGQGPKDR
jgi:WD40 repeat protein